MSTRCPTPTCCRSAARIRVRWSSPPVTTGRCGGRCKKPGLRRKAGLLFVRSGRCRKSELRLVVAGLVAIHRVDDDRTRLGRVAPAVELDPLAVFQVLVVLEEMADALQPVRADPGDVVDVGIAGEDL